MTIPDDGQELRERFAALREEDGAAVPRFHTPGAAPGRTRPWMGWGVAAALALALVAVVWLMDRNGGGGRGLVVDLNRVVWSAPTDFLLETPGRDLLRRLPDLGMVKAF